MAVFYSKVYKKGLKILNRVFVIFSVNKLGDEQKTAIIGIVIIIISVFYFIGKKIARKLIGKEILFPARYKLLVSIASVPIVIIIHKFLTIGLIKKNGQNNTNN